MRGWNDEEQFKISLNELPLEVTQVLFFVSYLYLYPSDIICEICDDKDGLIQKMRIQSGFIHENEHFEVVRLIM